MFALAFLHYKTSLYVNVNKHLLTEKILSLLRDATHFSTPTPPRMYVVGPPTPPPTHTTLKPFSPLSLSNEVNCVFFYNKDRCIG
jgi:hypothetical protein